MGTHWRIEGYDLEYGPRTVDYMAIGTSPNKTIRPKYIHAEQKMGGLQANRFSYIPEFVIYTMTWPIVTSTDVRHGGSGPLYEILMGLTMNKTITLYDKANDQDFNIQIIDRIKENIKTVNDGEILRSITLKIRFM